GCLGRDGHTRYGKIITTYTNRLIVPGASATTEFDGYKIDDISVQGKHVITNTGTTATRQFTVDVEGKLSKPNGNYTEWVSHKTITQIDGLVSSLFPLDDIFKIEGSAYGKVKRENVIVAWRNEIIEPLIKRFNCRWIVKGKVRIARENLSTSSQWAGILDFGNGNCDDRATITINSVVHEISLH
ncbi:MAG: hypothetical protein M3O67_09100, partial [Bacteroidota bacterium]|nr:hypothetical protein [Bacteroidota bacterium]